MATRMLIDARHPEETRVAVLKGNRIDEFDFESADRKQIKGNIYLAKVTRVEPSLQAAFVDFGGNRHGFLAFSEIHPDYYQIPKEDREALLAEEAAHAEEEAALRSSEDDDDDEYGGDGQYDDDDDGFENDENGGLTEVDTSEKDEVSTIESGKFETDDEDADERQGDDDENGDDENGDGENGRNDNDDDSRQRGRRGRRRQGGKGRSREADDLRARRMALRRRYKIQDVIQRRQVLLVQVVKEERGNKGAALTTYLSLAGRYCVLMPNSSHGGGISRKINSAADRKRLKGIIAELSLPRTMGCIVRTAGLQRTKTEIKRDFDYLARLWDELRERTLQSSAPSLIHSDSDLIKRAIRDIYNRDIEEVIVEGEEGYKAAKAFMKLLMPSHARRVKGYADAVPLFQRFGAEDQLSAMYDPVVQLKSGGYIVINPTEALVSIDINSGRSTKEHGIEATAVSTNLEAAHEIARQLRLRDMAGLVVIDFIDMEYGSNVRKVEKAMKDALKHDRARIQVGRISSFGLMEMSRQRLRTGVLESTTRACPHCDGTGLVRTASSAGLSALRLIEDEAAKGKGSIITLHASTEAAVYLLNAKRSDLAGIEAAYGVSVEVLPEGENEGAKMRVASSGPRNERLPVFTPIIDDDDDIDDEIEDDEDESLDEGRPSGSEGEDGAGRRKRRKRRRGGRGRDSNESGSDDAVSADDADDADSDAQASEAEATDGETEEDSEAAARKRRRRGGRRRRGRNRPDDAPSGEAESADGEDAPTAGITSDEQSAILADGVPTAPEEGETGSESPPTRRRPRRRKADAAAEEPGVEPGAGSTDEGVEPASADAPVDEAPAKPKRARRKKAEPEGETAPVSAEPSDEAPKPRRSRSKKAEAPADAALDAAVEAAPEPAAEADTAPAKPKRTRRKTAVNAAPQPDAEAETAETPAEETPAHAAAVDSSEALPAAADDTTEPQETGGTDTGEKSSDPPRRGWWQRTFGE